MRVLHEDHHTACELGQTPHRWFRTGRYECRLCAAQMVRCDQAGRVRSITEWHMAPSSAIACNGPFVRLVCCVSCGTYREWRRGD